MKKRILFSAYAFYPAFGGLEQQMYLLAQEYIRQGFRVDILTEKLSADAPSVEVIDNIHVYRTPYQVKRNFSAYVSLIISLSKFIIEHRNDYDFCMLRAALTLYPLVFGFWKLLGLIQYLTYVTADTGGDADEIIILKKNPLSLLMLPIFKQHDFFNSICEANYQHYLELGFNPKKLTKIYNGINISDFASNQPPQKIETFLFIGRFLRQKGIYELLNAFTQLYQRNPQIKLILAGDGPEKEKILDTLKELNIEKVVHYLGVINQQQKTDFYLSGDCLVLPSYSEGFGLVIAEAAVHKRAIITTDVADIKKIYGDKVFYTEKCNSQDLLKKMELVVKSFNPKDLDHQYDQIIPQFDIRQTATKIFDLMMTK